MCEMISTIFMFRALLIPLCFGFQKQTGQTDHAPSLRSVLFFVKDFPDSFEGIKERWAFVALLMTAFFCQSLLKMLVLLGPSTADVAKSEE